MQAIYTFIILYRAIYMYMYMHVSREKSYLYVYGPISFIVRSIFIIILLAE